MNRSFIKSLQGLRWIAAIMVFLTHTGYSVFSDFGNLAVSVFFILSGFLAQLKFKGGGGSNVKEVIYECKDSFLHSAKKYYPLHWIALLLVLPFSRAWFRSDPLLSTITLGLHITLLQSWAPQSQINNAFNGVAWYLSVLMFLTALSPIIVRLVNKLKKRGLCITVILCTAIRFAITFIVADWEFGPWFVSRFPPIRIIDYIVGCAACLIYSGIKDKLSNAVTLFILTFSLLLDIGLLVLGQFYPFGLWGATAWMVPSAGMIIALACGEKNSKQIRAIFSNKVSLFLGGISFELYLFHWVLRLYKLSLLHHLGLENNAIITAIELLIVLIVSSVIHYLYAWTIMKFKKRKDKRNSGEA